MKCTNVFILNRALFKLTSNNSTAMTAKLWKAYGFLVG